MKVVIVGAGPAGAALSLVLARNGVDVTLLERETDFDRVFRGEGLMPSGVDALYELGLDQLLSSLPFRKLESWDIFINGIEIMSVPEPYEELGDRAMRVIPQRQFLEGVIEEASTYPSFQFYSGVEVRELVKKDGRVSGVVANIEGQDQELPADLVVGCDGRASIVRARAGLKLKLLPVHYNALWFKLPAPPELQDTCRMMMYASNTSMGASYTSWDGRLQFALLQMKGEEQNRSIHEWAEVMGRPGPKWLADHFQAVVDEIEGPVKLNVIAGRCENWHAPGLLLLGDAAHPMEPIRAQGINLALRDVIVAANHLVPILKADGDPQELDAAAKAIQAEREPEIARSQTLQNRDTRGIGTWYTPLLIGLARALGPVMGKYRWAQNAWLQQQHDLRFGSTEVKLESHCRP